MLPGNIPLAFCTILVRKVIDSYTGALPAVVASSAIPTPLTAAVLSGALIGLYHQLRKGTLVKIGVGRKVSSFIRNSRHTIQRRVPFNSWFLKNAHACRRKCTEAMRCLARQSTESLEEIQRENSALPEISSMPDMRRTRSHALARRIKEPAVMNLFNRDSPDNDNSCIDLTQDDEPNIRCRTLEKQTDKPRFVGYGSVSHRPITRHFYRRNTIDEKEANTGTRSMRIATKSKTKSLSLPRVTKTTVEIPVVIRTDHDYQNSTQDFGRTRRPRRKASLNQSRSNNYYMNHSGDQADHRLKRRKSEQIERAKPIQKVTRKTRSGRIYAYRI